MISCGDKIRLSKIKINTLPANKYDTQVKQSGQNAFENDIIAGMARLIFPMVHIKFRLAVPPEARKICASGCSPNRCVIIAAANGKIIR